MSCNAKFARDCNCVDRCGQKPPSTSLGLPKPNENCDLRTPSTKESILESLKAFMAECYTGKDIEGRFAWVFEKEQQEALMNQISQSLDRYGEEKYQEGVDKTIERFATGEFIKSEEAKKFLDSYRKELIEKIESDEENLNYGATLDTCEYGCKDKIIKIINSK